MTTNRQFSPAPQALTELKVEPSPPESSGQPVPAAPGLSTILANIGPLPRQVLFLGVASDGLPVLLDLHDPHPGPMLVAGDAGSGKRAFLQAIARSAAHTHPAQDVEFGVITNDPDEWESLGTTPHCVGVFPIRDDRTREFVHSLATWAHSNKNSHQSVLLLIDDLESLASLEPETIQDFRWLLLRGPARRVWPIVTLNAPRYGQVIAWLQNFRARIFGRIEDELVAAKLGADTTSALDQLTAGIQFSLRENEIWLRFWLPSF